MRNVKKKELIEILEILEQANEEIERRRHEYGVDVISEVLTDCQERAIYIGTTIEESEGVDTPTVKLLEKYCESIYLLNEKFMDIQLAAKLLLEIQTLLNKIKNSILLDLPASKKEIVFLPYKASMWDSLESVWLAANEDETCKVSVVPIPYYDKDKDGSLGAMHYEGDAFPDYVPITSWKEYNIQVKHPDIIYIHNPYDGHNFVTSIHPDFYSKKLRECTELLVYIPYFVSLENVPEHLCVLPGTLYAHKVIVQSEMIRNKYIEEYRKFEQEKQCTGIFGNAEEKFIALGSPKFDKIIDTKQEDIMISDEWNKVIKNADGSKKIVVFYNTTIDAMLNQNKKMLDKIESVLRLFKTQEDVALLWRPHPLLETTIAAMRPELLELYKNIVETYRNEAWGIYDDTADLHRAIILSDAYYGDWSSIVALYEQLGKPIMVQNPDLIDNDIGEYSNDTM